MNSPRSKLRGITLASPKSVWRHSSPLQAAEYSAVGSMNSPRSKLRGITLASPKSVWRHSSPLQAAEYSAVGSINRISAALQNFKEDRDGNMDILGY
jgi:hypothetical protein